MKSDAPSSLHGLSLPEKRVLQAIDEVSFGLVEVVIHERKITEIRQTRRIRDFQKEYLPTGQPEENVIIQRNDDCVYRVVRAQNHRTHV